MRLLLKRILLGPRTFEPRENDTSRPVENARIIGFLKEIIHDIDDLCSLLRMDWQLAIESKKSPILVLTETDHDMIRLEILVDKT